MLLRAYWWPCAILALLLLWPHAAADFSPAVSKASHGGKLSWTYYFDDSPTVLLVTDTSVEISVDDGASWRKVPELDSYDVILVVIDPYVKDRAFAITKGTTQFFTNDRGATWASYELRGHVDHVDAARFSFHVTKPDLVIVEVLQCSEGIFIQQCTPHVFYTTDGLRTDPRVLLDGASTCRFAYSNKDFSSDVAQDTVLCARDERNSFGHTITSELVVSADFFRTSQRIEHPLLDSGKIIDMRVDSAFVVALVQKDKFALTSEISMLVSRDAARFEASDLGVLMKYGAVVFLDSNPLAIFLSTIRSKAFFLGELTMYASDSSGLRFSVIQEHMKPQSVVKSQHADGVWFTNVLGNSGEFEFMGTPLGNDAAYYTSKVSLDDGATWSLLEVKDDPKCKLSDGCSLQYFFMADVNNNDRLVTGPTPNILLTVGSAGKGHFDLDSAMTYVLRDGGVSWKLAIDQPTLYTFADQGNIIAAVPVPAPLMDRTFEPSDKFYYSLDQGETFQTLNLETPVVASMLTTTLDGSSTRVLLFGVTAKQEHISYTIDFSQAFGGKQCRDGDFEVVEARVVPQTLEPVCIRGQRESFKRRKQDAQCLVRTLFEDVKEQHDACDCTAGDFEPTRYFTLSEKGLYIPNLAKVAEYCAQQKKKTVMLPHQQLKTGNTCRLSQKQELDLSEKSKFRCDDYGAPPQDDNIPRTIISSLMEISGRLFQYSYVSAGAGLADNILLSTDQNVAYASNDGGSTFMKVPVGERIMYFSVGLVPGTVALHSIESIYYSDDGANTFTKYHAPGPPPLFGNAVSFHPTDANKYIYYTGSGCGSFASTDCTLFYTEDGGNTFFKMVESAGRCEYVAEALGTEENMVFCAVLNGAQRKLVSSPNYFKDTTTHYDSIVDFAVRSKFVFVATIAGDKRSLHAKVTADGTTFADADFPTNLEVDAQTAYTVLESRTQSIFLHVTTKNNAVQELGTIIKSNSNGTFYVSVLPDVNRSKAGYIDFDRVDILEGVMLANTVANPSHDEPKKLQTRISYNEGSEWHYLVPPGTDSEKKKYACAGAPLSRCALHLQGYTERPDFMDTFSSTGAIGFMIGVGNVGEYLGATPMATFLSTDGGVTWREIRKGRFMWEFGDRGTILLLVDAEQPTNEALYSTDNGQTWATHKFADEPQRILDIATVPTDTARQFVVFAEDPQQSNANTRVYALDFTDFYARQCHLDLDNPELDDFDYWTPRHPEATDNCFFGRETKYLRRAAGSVDCFIGALPLHEGSVVVRNCSCTRRDYECDYNYYLDNDGTCKLVDGLSPQHRLVQMCSKSDTFQYFQPTGYRKIPSSSCVGGKSLDSWSARACPGHEREFNEYYGVTMSTSKWLVVVLVPVAVFVAAVWFVYERGIRRQGGFQRLGQIRLDNDDFLLIEENSVDVVVNHIVRGGVVAVAAAIAVFRTLRKLDRKYIEQVWGAVSGHRPGSRRYVRVPDDEEELFGDFDDNYDNDPDASAEFDFDVQLDPEIFEDFDEEPADSRIFDVADDAGSESQ